jgi:hypothetical protein
MEERTLSTILSIEITFAKGEEGDPDMMKIEYSRRKTPGPPILDSIMEAGIANRIEAFVKEGVSKLQSGESL